MTNEKGAGRSPLKVLVTIIAIIVAILLATAVFQIVDHSKGGSYSFDSRDYIYPAENGRFGNLYGTAVRDMDRHAQYSTEVAECRALAFYYEQALLEHAYRSAGETEKADEHAARMREYEAQLGSMSSKAEEVRKSIES